MSANSPHYTLIVCDMQPDLLRSLPPTTRQVLLDSIQVCVAAARQATNWSVLFTGVQFESDYGNVEEHHKVYGGFKRLYQSIKTVQWFVKGTQGSKIEASLEAEESETIWQNQHLPPPEELAAKLRELKTTDVVVVGIKTAYAVQATCQVVCDIAGIMSVCVIDECIQDDIPERHDAVLNHLLPIYADRISLSDMVEASAGWDNYQPPPVVAEKVGLGLGTTTSHEQQVFYVANCGRGGHGPMFMSHLLSRSDKWREWPLQPWYTDNILNGSTQYECPLGKKVLDFCDEPRFSKTAMFIKGREWLDEKEKIIQIAGDTTLETFLIQGGKWLNGQSPPVGEESGGPWFVKDVNKNGGRAIQICADSADCMQLASDPDQMYVVQKHIANPHLTPDGRKCHLKFYSMLVGEENVWDLYVHRDAFLSTSPNIWSPSDLSADTQITVKRHHRVKFELDTNDWTRDWPLDEIERIIGSIVEAAIQERKLQDRPGKKQFEIFSADFIRDTSGRMFIIEFNFSPVLYDPVYYTEDKLTTAGLRLYNERYHVHGDKEIDDRAMVEDALTIVFDKIPPESRFKHSRSFTYHSDDTKVTE